MENWECYKLWMIYCADDVAEKILSIDLYNIDFHTLIIFEDSVTWIIYHPQK